MAEQRERTSGFGEPGWRAVVWPAWILPWALLILHLRTFWTLAPDYQYGWAVLPLGLYMLYRRWRAVNAVSPGDREAGGRNARWRTKTKGWRKVSIGNRGASAMAVFFAILILPIWWIRAATPDWSAISYALTLTVIAYTLALVASRATWGAAWRVAFPVCFILCAVPWPQRAETAIIQTLTKMIAAGAVEALQWIGVSAVRQGNLVVHGNGMLEVSDACSGIRSIQSMLVASLSLGELYSMRILRRFALVAAGLAIALTLNLLRNIVLALIATSSGLEAFERWHDRAGWAILLLSIPALFLLARRWRIVQETAPAGQIHLHPLPVWSAAVLAIWFCAVAGGVEFWYRFHEWHATEARRLEIRWPKEKKKFESTPIDDRTRDVLLCSDAQRASWTEEDGTNWSLTSITWAPGQTSAQSARVHRPEVCFQAIGAQFLKEEPPQPITIPGGALLFEPSEFGDGRQCFYVFFCIYEKVNRNDREELLQTRWARLHRAFLGQRNLGQQTVEVAVRGFADYASALKAVSEELPALLSLAAEGSR